MTTGLSSPEPEDGGAVSAEPVAMPADSAADGPTGSIADGKANNGRTALRDEMAAIAHAAVGPVELANVRLLPSPRDAVEQAITALFEAGYRRVVEGDDTCREIGRVIQHALARVADRNYDKASDAWADVGRAVVRALREETT